MTMLVKAPLFTIIFLLTLANPLFAGEQEGFSEPESKKIRNFFLNVSGEPVFREKRNITELLIKRIESENSVLESYLRKRLINDNFAQKLISENQTNYSFEKELRYLRSLGGLRLFSNGKLFFSYGDWTDLFLDSFSGQKLKSSELLRSFKYKEETEVVFFVRIDPDYPPVDFSFIGFESEFFLFQADGTLRYAKSDNLDYAIRLEAFQEIFQNIKRSNSSAEILSYGDFTLFFIPGKTPFSFYFFLALKFVITVFVFVAVIIFSFKLLEFLHREKIAGEGQSERIREIKDHYSRLETDLKLNEEKISSGLKGVKSGIPEAQIAKEPEKETEPVISKAEKIG